MEVKKMTHEEYLRKYIIGDEKKKKVKKKRNEIPTKKPIGMKIIDDDVDIKTIAAKNEDIVDECGDEAPVVAEIIDERPLKSRLQDHYKPSSWKRVGDDDDEEIDLKDTFDESDARKVTSSQSINSPRMRHDSDSDLSPERVIEKSLKVHTNSKSNHPKSTEDFSPPRKSNIKSARHDSDSDLSPTRIADKLLKLSENHKYKTRHVNSNVDFSPSRPYDNVQSTRHDSDSDLSPVRTTDKHQSSRNHKDKIVDSDSDFSPPRNHNTHSNRHDSDCDISSLKMKSLESTDKILCHSNKSSSSRKKHNLKSDSLNKTNSDSNTSRHKNRHDSDSDISSLKMKSLESTDKILCHSNKSSSSRKKHNLKSNSLNKTNSDSNSSRQKSRHDSDSDISSLKMKSLKSADKMLCHSNESSSSRKKHNLKGDSLNKANSDSKSSRRHDSDSDLSLSRKSSDSGSDISVPRNSKNKYTTDASKRIIDSHKDKKKFSSSRDLLSEQSLQKKKYSDHGSSVDRKRKHFEKNSKYSKMESQRDISPSTRKHRHSSYDELELPVNKRFDRNSSHNSKLGISKEGERHRPSTTLSGLKAGLQNSSVVHEEAESLRKQESKHIKEMDEELSGRNAQTIYRDRETGKKRDLRKEQEKKEEEDKEKAKKQEKYSRWGKGLEQQEQQTRRFEEDAYEMTKPLARYKDDEDLDKELRSKIYEEDPMFEYIQKKRKKQDNIPDFPKYNGPPPPPNRFNVQPGYRWDGVDRSNGFEKRYFDKISSAKAKEIESHLWSVQDM